MATQSNVVIKHCRATLLGGVLDYFTNLHTKCCLTQTHWQVVECGERARWNQARRCNCAVQRCGRTVQPSPSVPLRTASAWFTGQDGIFSLHACGVLRDATACSTCVSQAHSFRELSTSWGFTKLCNERHYFSKISFGGCLSVWAICLFIFSQIFELN